MTPPYEDMLEQLYRTLLRPGDVAIDVGAHVGRHAFPIADAVGAAGRVFCFEPLPQQYATLENRIASRDASARSASGEIVPHNLALGDEEGEANFTVVPDFPEYSGFWERSYGDSALRTESIRVQVRRLDALRGGFGKVRYMKIDAEGAELLILRGARALLAESRPVVSFEFGNAALVNYPYTAADCFDYFAGLGYAVYSIFGQALGRDEFVQCAHDQYFWDYFAIPSEQPWTLGHQHIGILVRQLATSGPAEDIESRARLEAVMGSLSWRVTAPLRKLATLLGARRGA